MEKKNRFLWIIAILALIGIAALVQTTLNNNVYLPVILAEATLTPSITPSITPSPSATPTKTATPTRTPDYDVIIFEIVNSDTTDPLNEYVSIFNEGSSAANLTGWYIRDDGLNRYDFPINFYIPSKGIIRLWTKEGQNTIYDLYWGSPVEVWNDFIECAYLRDDSEGEKVLVYKYCYPDDDRYFVISKTPSP